MRKPISSRNFPLVSQYSEEKQPSELLNPPKVNIETNNVSCKNCERMKRHIAVIPSGKDYNFTCASCGGTVKVEKIK